MTKRKTPPPVPFFTVEQKHNGFTVPTRLPSLNEYIDACRTNRYKGAKLKADTEAVIALAVMQALQRGELRRPTPPVRIAFTWHESTKRRDADNVASAKKYILDAMQSVGVIPNDSRKYVKGFTDDVVDDTRDFVEVKIYEVTK